MAHFQDDFYKTGRVSSTDPKKPPPWIMDQNGRMVYTPSGDNPWEPQLTPGADLAKRKGCLCSRLDNDYGRGHLVPDPELGYDSADTEFVITPHCPLHDHRKDESDTSSNR